MPERKESVMYIRGPKDGADTEVDLGDRAGSLARHLKELSAIVRMAAYGAERESEPEIGLILNFISIRLEELVENGECLKNRIDCYFANQEKGREETADVIL